VSDREAMIAIIYDAIDDLNPSLEVPIAKTPDTLLFGQGGRLDSVGLVNLVVSMEQSIEDRFGVSVSLADESAVSQARSPFRDVQTLADFASARVAAAKRDG
jgi:acyl carrier protein